MYKKILTSIMLSAATLTLNPLKAEVEIEMKGVQSYIGQALYSKEGDLLDNAVGSASGLSLEAKYTFSNDLFTGYKIQDLLSGKNNIVLTNSFFGKKYTLENAEISPKVNVITFGPVSNYEYNPMVEYLASVEAISKLGYNISVRSEVGFGASTNNERYVINTETNERTKETFSSASFMFLFGVFQKVGAGKYGAEIELKNPVSTNDLRVSIINFSGNIGYSF